MFIEWLLNSKHTVLLTGAGMSTESGLPDFRSSSKGLWEQKDPSLIASTDALNKNVEQFIHFYQNRVLGVKECKPHNGHFILASWERKGLIHKIITQNVDGFHQQAGSIAVTELHGTLQKVHCQHCGKEHSNNTYVTNEFTCECGGILRPSIVLFGEMLPENAIIQASEATDEADLFIVLGSSLSVTPANQFPLIAKENGAKLVIVNMEPTSFDAYADLVIHNKKIGEWLMDVDTQINNRKH